MNSQISIDPASVKSKAVIQSWGKDLLPPVPFLCQGPENAKIFIIDSQAFFFNGEPGQLLTRILTAMGLAVGDVLICNCDVPGAVQKKIRKVMPKMIITLGEEAG